MDGFLDNDDVVKNLPPGYEPPLRLRNNMLHDIFHSCSKNFCENLVRSVAKRDCSESIHGIRIFFLRNQREER